MGCCNGSVVVLVLCTLQLITIVERLIIDFLGFLYLALIPSFIQIIVVIVSIFGLCLYKHKLLIVHLIWSVLFLIWNAIVICLYLDAGSFSEQSKKVLSFNTSTSFWIKLTQSCDQAGNCTLSGSIIEVIHAAIQIVLSLASMIACSYVIYLLREKDDPSPIFQVYKAPSSRRSSVSVRLDRETTLTRAEPTDNWEVPLNARDSLRSNRSVRSNRSDLVRRANDGDNPNTSLDGRGSTRHSKRSNRSRSSTRSKSKNKTNAKDSEGSIRAKRPNSLPWVPQITPSTADSDNYAHSPITSRRAHADIRKIENESHGYGSSSDNPYGDHHQKHVNKAFSPGSPAIQMTNRHGNYKPTDLSHAFNAVADLPPPLDEGPEAYSRDNTILPPPPANVGSVPYYNQRTGVPNLNLNLKSYTASSSPSSPVSTIDSTKKSLPSDSSSPSTPVKENPSLHGANRTSLPLTTENLKALGDITRLNIVPPNQRVNGSTGGMQGHGHQSSSSTSKLISETDFPNDYKSRAFNSGTNNINSTREAQRDKSFPSPPNIASQNGGKGTSLSPQKEAHHPGYVNVPRDNTFRRMVTGNLSSYKVPSDTISVSSHYSEINKMQPKFNLQPEHPIPKPSGVVYPNPSFKPLENNAGPRKLISPENSNKSLPPWERNVTKPDYTSKQAQTLNDKHQQYQNMDSSIPKKEDIVTEVTSNYVGLYSSNQAPATRRSTRGGKPQNSREPLPMKGNFDTSNYNEYGSKQSKGPFVSSTPLVI